MIGVIVMAEKGHTLTGLELPSVMVDEALLDEVTLSFSQVGDTAVCHWESHADQESPDRRPDDPPSYPLGEECGGEDDTDRDRESDDECQK